MCESWLPHAHATGASGAALELQHVHQCTVESFSGPVALGMVGCGVGPSDGNTLA